MAFSRIFIFPPLLSCLICGLSRAGTIETRDGHKYDGDVRLSDDRLSVRSSEGQEVAIPLSELRHAFLNPAATEPAAGRANQPQPKPPAMPSPAKREAPR